MQTIHLTLLILLAAAGLHNSALYVMRRKDAAPLFFALFCFLLAINAYVSGPLVPYAWRQTELLHKIDILTILASIPCFLIFIRQLFPAECSGRLVWIIASVTLLYVPPVVAVNGTLLEFVYRLYFPVIFALITICLSIGIRAVYHGRSDSRWVLWGIIVMSVGGINDLLWALGVAILPIIMPYTTVVFAVLYSVLMSRRFARAEVAAEQLTRLQQKMNASRSIEEKIQAGSKLVELALACYTDSTGHSKFDLARACGFWKVHINPDGWERTQTLDRYLQPKTFPQNPRWNQLVKTAQFVLDHCPAPTPLRLQLEQALAQMLQ